MQWEWSDRVDQAEWLSARRGPGAGTWAIPGGFPACARLLHPVPTSDEHGTVTGQVRWSDVARWSGVSVELTSRFWQIALPEVRPADPVPGDGSPASDVLGWADGQALAQILRAHTTTPEQGWFGLWVGYYWVSSGVRQRDAQAASPPPSVFHLHDRDYLLYHGPVEAGLAFLPEQRELADLWWPQDRAWFVYGDVDLNSTYVAGSSDLVNALLASAEVEAIAADPRDPVVAGVGELPDWLARRVDGTVADLLKDHRAEFNTSRFAIRFELTPTGPAEWRLDHQADGLRHSGGQTWLSSSDLTVAARQTVIAAIVNIVEG